MSQNPQNLKCYKGNPLIKGDGESQIFSAYEISEYKKCMADPKNFARKYVKIISLDKGLTNFDLWPYQENLYDTIQDNRYIIVKSSRQSGKSQSIIVYVLWFALFNPNKTIVILANKGDTATEMLLRITLTLENLPFFIQPGCKAVNRRSLEFSNGSRIYARGTSSSSIRGMTCDLVVLDEFGIVKDDKEFYKSTYPTITSGKNSKVIISSTPKGIGNMFHRLWNGAVSGINEFVPIEVSWRDVPGRDDDWMRKTIANTSQRDFNQEFGCEFLGSGNTLIDSETLLSLRAEDPIETAKDVRYYHTPKSEHRYCVLADPAKGRGKDSSALSVVDMTSSSFDVVANYSNNLISPLLFPTVIHDLARLYNNAYVIVESNDVGAQVVTTLVHELGYDNVFSGGASGKKALGLQMTQKTKRIGCSHFKDLLEKNVLLVHDKELISQICSFEAKGSSFEAASGCHDDLVMTLVAFGYFASQSQFAEFSDASLREILYSKEEVSLFEDQLVPFGIIDRGDGDVRDRSSGRYIGDFGADGKFRVEMDDDFGWAVIHEEDQEDPDKWH